VKFGIEFAFEKLKDMSESGPMIRAVACRVFNLAHPQIADSEAAPDGLSGDAGMHGLE